MTAIVTDSSVCISSMQAKKLGIKVAPMTYTVNNQLYSEQFTDKNGDFIRLIDRSVKTSTAHPGVSAFMSIFNDLVKQNINVVCIVISSVLSGAYSSAVIAAKEFEKGRVTVIDSKSVAGGLYLLVKHAAAMAGQGKSPMEIEAEITKMRTATGIIFSVDNIENLRKGGRVSFLRQVTNILNRYPILKCRKGSVVYSSVSRGSNDKLAKLINGVPPDVKELSLYYATKTKEYLELYKRLKHTYPKVPISFGKVTPVLYIHLGKGAIGISFKQ